MKTLEEVVAFTKHLLTKYGQLDPTLLIEGTAGGVARPFPDAEEPVKLALCGALGFTLAREGTIGELGQVFLLSEGWRSHAPYAPGVKATQPKHDPHRVEVV